jgi:hypothetical protein
LGHDLLGHQICPCDKDGDAKSFFDMAARARGEFVVVQSISETKQSDVIAIYHFKASTISALLSCAKKHIQWWGQGRKPEPSWLPRRRAAASEIIPDLHESLGVHLAVLDGVEHGLHQLPACGLIDLRRTACARRWRTAGLNDIARGAEIIGGGLLARIEHAKECEHTLPTRPDTTLLGLRLSYRAEK